MKEQFHVYGIGMNGASYPLPFALEDFGNVLRFSITKRMLENTNLNTVVVETELLKAKTGENGYFLYPTNFGCGFVTTYFTPREDASFLSWLSATPVCGLCENERGVFARVDGHAADAHFRVKTEGGIYSISTLFELQGDEPEEDISIYFYRMPNAGYVEMAREYRKYQMEVKGCRPLKERMLEREPLRKASEAMEIRVRMGWKPIPTPVRHQTPATEPPLHVTCTIEMLERMIDKLQENGIDKAEICLVGWGPAGHDGRFPQQYPSDPRYGGDPALKRFIARAQRLGYQIVAHTVSCGAYEIANNFDIKDLAKRRNEKGEYYAFSRDIYKLKGLNGGEPYAVCPQRAYERYAKDDLPIVRGYGFSGMFYIDELTAYTPEKCCDPDHPVSRKQAQEYYRKIARLATSVFGGYQCEGYMDFMNADLDSILYVGCHTKDCSEFHPIFGEGVPFWQIVYHGIIMSNPTSETVNYTMKSAERQLLFFEYGGRPVMYFNSKFGPGRDWMGKVDLYSRDDNDLDEAMKYLKTAYEEYEALQYLQYEYMDDHRKLSDGVYRTEFSDGTVIITDYNALRWEVTKPDGTVLSKQYEKENA
ncbi:MAG: hypothetical protein II370_05610 [Clostridia bacterium]|nr:hypothetical protein [Clostridia bacterium]